MKENKTWSSLFDKRNGDTALQRLTVWLRRRNIRNLALCTALILWLCVEFFIFYCLDAGNADLLFVALVILCLIGPVYLPLWFWLIMLVFRPDKCSGMRRLKRLGNLEKFVSEMEEDLVAGGFIQIQKYVCVTRRFIIEASPFYFRLYPLEELREFDNRKTRPVFYYENGTSCKVVTNTPFYMLKPYIKPENDVFTEIAEPESGVDIETVKPKLAKKDIIDLVVFVCIAVALFCLSWYEWGLSTVAIVCCGMLLLFIIVVFFFEMFTSPKNREKNFIVGCMTMSFITGGLCLLMHFNLLPIWGIFAAALCGSSILFHWFASGFLRTRKNNRLVRMLLEIKDIGEKINKMEKLYAEGWFKDRGQYLNQLSALYYEKEDVNKALELVREALHIQSGKREYRMGAELTLSEMMRLNEVVYLTALERFDEAKPLFTPFCDKQYKNPDIIYIVNATRAEFAIRKGNMKAAREYLHQVDGLFSQISIDRRQVNIFYHLLLLEAKCDLLEQDTASALTKLDAVQARSTWPPSVKAAGELKESIQQKKKGVRRRGHSFRSNQSKRHSNRRHASARRQLRQRKGYYNAFTQWDIRGH